MTIAGARLFRIVLQFRKLAAAANHSNHTGSSSSVCSHPSSLLLMNETPAVALSQVFPSVAQEEQSFPTLPEERDALESRGWHLLIEILHDLRSGAVQLPGAGQLNTGPFKHIGSRLLKVAGYYGTYIGILVCGIVTAGLATDSTALSTIPSCGVYMPSKNTTGPSTALQMSIPYETSAQIYSAKYAHDCYHTYNGADGCNFFIKRSINYTTTHNASCPFTDYMCHGGASSAVAFTTGPVNARSIGINAPKTYEFKRDTTCSPLNMNESFIQLSKSSSEYTFSYHYGSGDSFGDHSWETKTYGSDIGRSPSYLVGYVRPMILSSL